MKDSDTISSWDELLASLETAVSHPVDTAWQIYRYLQNNYTTMGSHQVRMLLVAYLKLPVDRPSLVHSCVLGIAVKISSEYADFQFPQFLQMWGYDRYLREEDKQKQLFRLVLSENVAKVIRLGMGLLGIEMPERM